MQGLTQLYDTIRAVKQRQNPSLTVAGLLLVKYSGCSNLENRVYIELGELAERMESRLFSTAIRECVKVKEVQIQKKLLTEYAPSCSSMQDYNAFAEELLERI